MERVPSKRPKRPDTHDEDGKFRKGHRTPNPGRAKGVHNKLTRDIKEGILDGAVAHGLDGKGKGGLQGYLTMCAAKYPKNYMYLLAKLLPFVVRNTVDATLRVQKVNVVPVQSDRYVTAEQMLALAPDRPTLDLEALDVTDQTKQ
jgi:hypothetical protein